MLVTCILANFAADLSGVGVGLFIKSRNNTLYQRRENLFLGEKLIAWGKVAEGKTPTTSVTFLEKKKTNLKGLKRHISLSAQVKWCSCLNCKNSKASL